MACNNLSGVAIFSVSRDDLIHTAAQRVLDETVTKGPHRLYRAVVIVSQP